MTAPAHAAPIPPAAVLAWAAATGAALAPRGPVGLALLAPRVLGAVRPLEVPAPVRAALSADWCVLRALLDDTHAVLGRAGLPGWPASLDGASGAAVLTVATWAAVVRYTLADDAEGNAWRTLARAELARGAPRWLAALAASERLAGPETPCPAVRARHLAALRTAAGDTPPARRAA